MNEPKPSEVRPLARLLLSRRISDTGFNLQTCEVLKGQDVTLVRLFLFRESCWSWTGNATAFERCCKQEYPHLRDRAPHMYEEYSEERLIR